MSLMLGVRVEVEAERQGEEVSQIEGQEGGEGAGERESREVQVLRVVRGNRDAVVRFDRPHSCS
jgi:hypothetical protein